MVVEGVGVLALGFAYALVIAGADSSFGLFFLGIANAVPAFVSLWLVFGLVFLAGLRPRPRFVSIRWGVFAWIRLMVVLNFFTKAYPGRVLSVDPDVESMFVPGGAATFAVISAVLYTRLHRRARKAGALPSFTLPKNEVFALLAVGEVAFVASLSIAGEGYDLAAWQTTAWLIAGAWLPGWLSFMLWVTRRRRAGREITRLHFLLASSLRAWIGVAIYVFVFAGLLEDTRLPFLWWMGLVLPLIYCGIAGFAFNMLPALVYFRLTGAGGISSSTRTRVYAGLSIAGILASAGVELVLIMLSKWRYGDYLTLHKGYVQTSQQLYALALLPVLGWVLVRLPVLIWLRGWKAIGVARFLTFSTTVSFLAAFGFHSLFGPQELSIEWLLVMTSFGLLSGLGYILDCKLRADELLPS